MADILSPEKRSQNMAAIKSRDTKPEIYLRKLLYAKGFRYRIAYNGIIWSSRYLSEKIQYCNLYSRLLLA